MVLFWVLTFEIEIGDGPGPKLDNKVCKGKWKKIDFRNKKLTSVCYEYYCIRAKVKKMLSLEAHHLGRRLDITQHWVREQARRLYKEPCHLHRKSESKYYHCKIINQNSLKYSIFRSAFHITETKFEIWILQYSILSIF